MKAPLLSFWKSLPAVVVLIISLGVTLAAWSFETRRATAQNELRFARASQDIQADIRVTMQAYGQFLRSGVALFDASEGVTRAEWARFVTSLAFEENYAGIQALSYNAVIQGDDPKDAFIDLIRRTDRPDFKIFPETENPVSVPVLYIGPVNELNSNAIGFDIYTEVRRRNAVNRAIAAGAPHMTAKITLLQDGDPTDVGGVNAGVLLMSPIYADALMPDDPAQRLDATIGVIVSVFRVRDMMTSVLGRHSRDFSANTQFVLYDAVSDDPDAIVFRSTAENEIDVGQFASLATFDVFGRQWSLRARSTTAYDALVKSRVPGIFAGAGVLLSCLLTAMTWAQSWRAQQSAMAAEKSLSDQARIHDLLREVSHRSKNMLAVVRVIAHQTAATHPDDFLPRFSRRVESLAASQDLLIRSDWKGATLYDLASSQLLHLSPKFGLQIKIDGPDIALGPAASQTVGMALHELATNAAKYGALSTDAGQVSLNWFVKPVDGVDHLHVSWVESGGPVVTPSHEKGFGSVVLDRITRGNLQADVALTFEPEGVQWHLNGPMEAMYQ